MANSSVSMFLRPEGTKTTTIILEGAILVTAKQPFYQQVKKSVDTTWLLSFAGETTDLVRVKITQLSIIIIIPEVLRPVENLYNPIVEDLEMKKSIK